MKKIWTILRIIIVFVVLVLSGWLVKELIDLDMIPNKYLYLIIAGIVILNIIGIIGIFVKKIWTNIVSGIIYVILIILCGIGIKYVDSTNDFLDNGFNNYEVEKSAYNVVVLKDSNYDKIESLNNKTMGYIDNITISPDYLSEIKSKINIQFKSYKDVSQLYKDLKNNKIDSFVSNSVYLDLLEEVVSDSASNIRIIYSYEYEDKIIINNDVSNNNSNSNSNSNNTSNDVSNSNSSNKTSTSNNSNTVKQKSNANGINILISGSDSRTTNIVNNSLSDVNMIMTLNPSTRTILLTSIPRDYYIQLPGTTGLRDKLTHSGMYGMNMTKKTIESIFDIKIDYTVKVGFTSVVKLVDLIGGVDVYSDITFNSYHIKGWVVPKGWNHLDGEHALAYARERYAYKGGDRHRVLNQQQVLEAIMNKMFKNKSLLLKYDELLQSFSSFYLTDMPKSVIQKLVKNQLNNMSAWKIVKQSVDGKDSRGYTYTIPETWTYVMEPSQAEIDKARSKIISVYNE